MKGLLTRYMMYLRIERACSLHTLANYRLELEKFLLYLLRNNIEEIAAVTVSWIREYIYHIKDTRNLSNVTLYTKRRERVSGSGLGMFLAPIGLELC